LPSWEQAASGVLRLLRLSSIKQRILIFALLATLIPSLTLGWRSYLLNRQFITQKLAEDLRDSASSIVRELNLWLKERLYEVRVFSSSYEVTENLEELARGSAAPARLAEANRRLTDYLKSVQGRFRDYEELLVIDPAGRVLYTSGDAPGGAVPADSLRAARPDAPVVGGAYWDEARRKGVILVAVPVIAPSGRALGLLAGKVNFTAVEGLLRTHALGSTGQTYVMTPDGSIVAGSGTPSPTFKQARLPVETARVLFAQPEVLREYADGRGRSVIGTSKPVPQLGWNAVADITWNEAYGQTARLRTITLALVGGLLVVIGLTAYLLGLTVVRPLERLTRGAARVAAGDLDVTLPVVDRGEVGYLTRAFNNMVARLRQSRDDLAAANAALSQKNEELQKLSTTDSLTGLNNRRHLAEVLTTEVARCRRLNQQFAVLLIDIDHFKEYNDTYGHPAGDRLLVRLAGLFRDSMRAIDYAARYGGEEFLVLLFGAGRKEAAVVAERIRARVAAEPFGGGAEPARVTVSLGVAMFPGQGDTAEAVVGRADAALYEAKRNGRNQVVTASDDEPAPTS
jgi:diguanylate cyclase (GGDEF)-like protein